MTKKERRRLRQKTIEEKGAKVVSENDSGESVWWPWLR